MCDAGSIAGEWVELHSPRGGTAGGIGGWGRGRSRDGIGTGALQDLKLACTDERLRAAGHAELAENSIDMGLDGTEGHY